MNQNESWIAEQSRLLTLEDGFGPGYLYIPESGGSSNSSSQPSGDSSSSA